MSGIDYTGTTYPLGPLPPVTREGNDVFAGEWSFDLRDDPPTVEAAAAYLAAALWFADPGLYEDIT